jgi:SRSO17 transposase
LADDDAVLVIDETGFLKQGKASCQVATQYTVRQAGLRTARSRAACCEIFDRAFSGVFTSMAATDSRTRATSKTHTNRYP